MEDQQSNNDIMPLAGGNRVQRRVQATQDLLLADPYAPLKRIDSKFKTKPKEGDQLVTPETCLYWLSLNTSNRVVTDARVYDLAEFMTADEWHNTFNPVLFYTGDGGKSFILANGQTRMWAGWLTGCTVEHTVRITDDPKVLTHIDDHKARTVGDLLSTKKYANYNVVASATGFVRAYQEFDPPFAGAATMHNGPHYQRGEILEFVEDNPDFVRCASCSCHGRQGMELGACWPCARSHRMGSIDRAVPVHHISPSLPPGIPRGRGGPTCPNL
jgi:hypothetical protein